MPSDQVVEAPDVLRAVMDLRRAGLNAGINELESLEPALLDYWLEETTAIHGLLAKSRMHSQQVRQVHKRVQSLAFVLVASLRLGYQRLWTPEQEAPSGATPGDDPSVGGAADDPGNPS